MDWFFSASKLRAVCRLPLDWGGLILSSVDDNKTRPPSPRLRSV